MTAYYTNNDVTKPDPVMCELTKYVTKLAMKTLVYIQENDPNLYAALEQRGKSMAPWESSHDY